MDRRPPNSAQNRREAALLPRRPGNKGEEGGGRRGGGGEAVQLYLLFLRSPLSSVDFPRDKKNADFASVRSGGGRTRGRVDLQLQPQWADRRHLHYR